MTEMSRDRRRYAQDALAAMEQALRSAQEAAQRARSLLSESRHYDLAQLTVVDTAALQQQVATLATYIS